MAIDAASRDSSLASVLMKIGLVVALLAGAVYVGFLRGASEWEQPDDPELARAYVCQECGHVFELTPAGFEQLHLDGGIQSGGAEGRGGALVLRCPSCGQFAGMPGQVCPKDDTIFAPWTKTGEPGRCPKCGWTRGQR